jgi:acylphosphatase
VRNLRDGAVEAVFEGSVPAVDQMIAWCRRGPRMAHVRSVVAAPENPTDAVGFTISF